MTKVIKFNNGNLGIQLKGNKVEHILPGSLGEKEKVEVGWIITHVNGQKQSNESVSIMEEMNKTNSNGQETTITFNVKDAKRSEKQGFQRPSQVYSKSEPYKKANTSSKQIENMRSPYDKAHLEDRLRIYREKIGNSTAGKNKIRSQPQPHRIMRFEIPWWISFSNSHLKDWKAIISPYVKNMKDRWITDIINFCQNSPNIERLMDANHNLQEIAKTSKHLSAKDASKYGYFLTKTLALKKIYIGNNNIGDDGALAIAAGLEKNSTLILIDLSVNSISDKGAEGLGRALKKNTCLTSLDIRKNHYITQEGAKNLAVAIVQSETLRMLSGIAIARIKNNDPAFTNLNLTFFCCCNTEAHVLTSLLKSNTSITSFDFRYNTYINEWCAKPLAESIIKNNKIQYFSKIPFLKLKDNDPSITSLTVGQGCHYTEEHVMAHILETNAVLQSLHWNQIGVGGIHTIASSLQKNNILTKLYLENNSMEDKGAEAIGHLLKFNSKLKYINLTSNNISKKGAESIANGLAQNNSLEILVMDENELGDEGTRALAESLSKNSTLTKLHLGQNQIGDIGAKAFGDILQKNKGLKELSLYRNNISDSAIPKIVRGMKINQTLQKILLGRNKITMEGQKQLKNRYN